MVETLSPRDAANLIAAQGLDLVDVRDEHEWARGHIPGARLVPLDQLRADPDRALTRDGIVFVCAKGVRSLTAAKIAERLGYATVYNLEGGTAAWSKAGLPIDVEHATAQAA
jgi:adenylyltransferase/sulfurtransferase